MADAEKAALKAQRGILTAHLTRFSTFLTSLDTNPERIIQLKSRLEQIEGIFKEFGTMQTQIEILENTEEQINKRVAFEDKYFDLISRAKLLTSKRESMVQISPTNTLDPKTRRL